MQKKTLVASFVLAALMVAMPALAGPPFLCHPFDIGTARSLPWSAGNEWTKGSPAYDIGNVVADTDAILTPSTPVPVRMETLRRASLYASHDRALAGRLLSMLVNRAENAERIGKSDGMAFFDVGYVIEAFDEVEALGGYETQWAAQAREVSAVKRSHDPQLFLYKSQAQRPDDGAVDLALSLIMRNSQKKAEHLSRAMAAAQHDELLASNLVRLQLP